MRNLLAALALLAVGASPVLAVSPAPVHPPISIRIPGKLPLDLCRNLPGIQSTLPAGYHLGILGGHAACLPD